MGATSRNMERASLVVFGDRRRRTWTISTTVAVVVVVAAAMWWAGAHVLNPGAGIPTAQVSPAPVSDYGPAPTYRLIDQTGKTVSSQRFSGQVQVVSFLFPYCTSSCPVLARELAQVQHILAREGLQGKVVLVTFNVDPGDVPPRHLMKFLRQYGADARPSTAEVPWYFLTGQPGAVRKVVRGSYHVGYWRAKGEDDPGSEPNDLAEHVSPGYDVKHQDIMFLVDGDGRIRRLYNGTDDITPEALVSAVHDLVD